MAAWKPGTNRPSQLLTQEENNIIFQLLPPRCISLATSVVQLFTTKGPAHNEWIHMDTGVLCFIKNNQKRSYFFTMFCMERGIVIWDQEVYNQIQYKTPRSYFHTFEADEYMVAFNFASEIEALLLKSTLYEKIELKIKKRAERQRKSILQENRISKTAGKPVADLNRKENSQVLSLPQSEASVKNNESIILKDTFNTNTGKNKKSKARKLTKADISFPKDFKHVFGPSNINGWDSDKGLDIDNLLKEVNKEFFTQAGVSESQLRDKETRIFIADFISKNGGVNAAQEVPVEKVDEKSSNAPWTNLIKYATLPRKSKNRRLTKVDIGLPKDFQHVLTVPVVGRDDTKKVSLNINPASLRPPPASPRPLFVDPPPRRAKPKTHQSMRTIKVGSTNPPALSLPPPSFPPPMFVPPPPPLPSNAELSPRGPSNTPTARAPPAPPPPPKVESPEPQNNDPRSALLDSICGGKQLKRVEPNSGSSESSKGSLLQEIHRGVELKSVPVSENKERRVVDNSLAGALALALEERSKAMRSDSSSSSDSTSEENEWED